MKKVKIYFHDSKVNLNSKKRLKVFIEELFEKENKKLKSLLYIFCSDEYLLDINNRFLKHDYYTDVISFNLAAPEREVEGEVYISIDRVKENAKKADTLLNIELHRVIFHGALHLCGYNDNKKEEISIMRQKEEKTLMSYFK